MSTRSKKGGREESRGRESIAPTALHWKKVHRNRLPTPSRFRPSSVPAIATLACCALWLALACAPLAFGQQAKSERLIDQPAFDILTLDAANDNKVLKIHPVKLPGRRIPEKPKGMDVLRIKLLEDGEEYEVAWFNIVKLELFEALVLAETNKLVAEGKFDEAYEDLNFLFEFYPQVPGLAEARHNFLYQSAGAAFKQQDHEEALAILEELLAQNPSYRAGGNSPTLLTVLGNIVDPLLANYLSRQDYSAVRTLLSRLAKQYKADNEPFIQRWRTQLTDLAARQRDLAQQHLAAGKLLEAQEASRAMQNIWPELPGSRELFAEIARRHPRINIGVEAPALTFDSRSLHDAAARRAGRLTERLLVELVGLGPEGGKYDSTLGTVSRSADGLGLSFQLPASPAPSAPYDLVQQLLARAEPASAEFLPAWARIVSSVRLSGPGAVEVAFRVPHVLPQALLRGPLDASPIGAPTPATPFVVHSREGAATRFMANPTYAFRGRSQAAEIAEQFLDDPVRALADLKQGQLDVLERVFPGDIAMLQADASLTVAPYQAPTTHVLAVRSENPYLANATFRRALLLGSNRELLLQQGILRGKPRPGFRVVSGPFAAPAAVGDLTAYAYDSQIDPRPYDPRLALTLRLVAENEVQTKSEEQKTESPKLEALTLGHPADEISRIACRGLVRQWKLIDVTCKLKEFPPGVFDDAENVCDLVYFQLAAWEPVVDAGRLLGQYGLAPAESSFIQLTVRQIESARNWREARERLLHLHRLLHEDVTLLPLWQTLDHFAYRRTLQGISAKPIRLYQDVEQWHGQTQLAGAKP
jgi:hypothetical protein